MVFVCERWTGDGDRLLYWPSSTTFSSWLGCSTVGHWWPKALRLQLALISASCLQLTQTVGALVILLFNSHLLPLFFRLFTLVYLLIDGSVDGQYITRVVGIHVVHPYSSIDMTAAKKKLCFILSVRSDFHMTDRLSLAVRAFASRVLTSFSVTWHNKNHLKKITKTLKHSLIPSKCWEYTAQGVSKCKNKSCEVCNIIMRRKIL